MFETSSTFYFVLVYENVLEFTTRRMIAFYFYHKKIYGLIYFQLIFLSKFE